VTENLMNVSFALGLFIAVGQKGSITTSPNGIDWTPRTSKHTGFIWDVATDGQHLVAAAQWGRVLTSSDGANWTVHETELPGHLTDVAFGNGTFIAVGWDGQIVQSDSVGGDTSGDIRLSNAAVNPEFSFQFNTQPGQSYHVEASTNLTSWSVMSNLVANATSTSITDELKGSRRFYRAVQP
jgi:hypothetical protein